LAFADLSRVSACADTRHEAPREGDFNRPEQAVTEVTFSGRRPMVGLRRPVGQKRQRRLTPGARAPKEGDFNRPEQAVTEVTFLGPQASGRPSPTFLLLCR